MQQVVQSRKPLPINSSSSITTQTSFVQPTCGLDNGSAAMTVSGGSLPYPIYGMRVALLPVSVSRAPRNHSLL